MHAQDGGEEFASVGTVEGHTVITQQEDFYQSVLRFFDDLPSGTSDSSGSEIRFVNARQHRQKAKREDILRQFECEF